VRLFIRHLAGRGLGSYSLLCSRGLLRTSGLQGRLALKRRLGLICRQGCLLGSQASLTRSQAILFL